MKIPGCKIPGWKIPGQENFWPEKSLAKFTELDFMCLLPKIPHEIQQQNDKQTSYISLIGPKKCN